MRLEHVALAALVAVAAITIDAHAEERARGQLLHDTYCVGCHDSKVYTRQERIAHDYPEVRAQTLPWVKNIGLKWEDADVDAVAAFIGGKYYGLSCPENC